MHGHTKRLLITLVITVVVLLISGGCSGGASVQAIPTQAYTSELPTPRPTMIVQPTPTPDPDSMQMFEPGAIILYETQTFGVDTGSAKTSFEAGGGQVVRIDTQAIAGTSRHSVELRDKYDTVLAGFTTGIGELSGKINEFRLPYDGRYTLSLIPAEGADTVNISVTALDAPSGGGDVTELPGIFQSVMSTRQSYHTFRLYLTAGNPISLRLEGDSAFVQGLDILLQAPNGQMYTPDSDLSIDNQPTSAGRLVRFVSRYDGLYTLLVQNRSASTGAYKALFASDAATARYDIDPDMVYGQDYRAGFYEGSDLTATFDGVSGDVLMVELYGLDGSVNADLRLINPSGQVIAYSVSPAFGADERIDEIQLPVTGRYSLHFRAQGGGQGIIRISLLSADELTGGGDFREEVQAAGSGRFNGANTYHVYRFTGGAGDRVSITVKTADGGAILQTGTAILAPDGRQISYVGGDSSLSRGDPVIDGLILEQSGYYVIIVFPLNGTRGVYEIQLAREE